MITTEREKFNEAFTEDKYKNILDEVNTEFPGVLDFRMAETPVFIDLNVKTKLLSACNSIIDTLCKPNFKELTKNAIPENLFAPNETEHPEFLAIDFAITQDENKELNPQLIELQGFPSLFAYQAYLSEKYTSQFSIDTNTFSPYLNRLTQTTYIHEMENFLKNGHEDKHVVLLEIYPEKQKTRLDFALTKKYWNINTVCLTKVIKKGNKLYYDLNGEETQIKRIYNRVINDEIEKTYPGLETDFKFSDDVDVEWVNHPNWYFRVSKYCLPLLKSKFVPKSFYLSDLKEWPADLENYVLKPLFSFAGAGVNIHVKKEDLEVIKDPENYLLQEKISYQPIIKDPEGNLIKTEVRMLYIWPKGHARPKLMTNLCRLSKGEMIGVAFNKDFDWVGGSSGFFEKK